MSNHRTGPPPGLVAFVAVLRTVVRTAPDSPVDGPEALERWDDVGGYEVRWSTRAGQWRVTAGAAPDQRPLLHGPDGYWRVDASPGEHAAGMVLGLLRAAGALPPPRPAQQEPPPVVEHDHRWPGPAVMPPAPPAGWVPVRLRPAAAVVAGRTYAAEARTVVFPRPPAPVLDPPPWMREPVYAPPPYVPPVAVAEAENVGPSGYGVPVEETAASG